MRFEFNDDSQKICNSVDVVNYGIQCDICGNKVLSVSNINGKRYCAGCYYKTFMKDNQKAEIDQLKQENEKLFLQLSKQEIDEHKPVYCTLAGTDCKYLGKIKELKQQLAEKDKEIAHLKEKDNYRLRYELAGADETITNLKQQLAEKDIRIEELEGQFAYECECNKQLVELQKQLEEKQNTIDEINKEFVQAVHDWKTLCAEKDKEIEELKLKLDIRAMSLQNINIERMEAVRNQTQLAVAELEKVKEEFGLKSGWSSETDMCFDLEQFIKQQIKELEGEK